MFTDVIDYFLFSLILEVNLKQHSFIIK